MWHIGIDLHRETVVIAAVNDHGEVIKPVTVRCEDTVTIVNVIKALGSFRAVIEASATYRWLYDLLQPYGTILLAHPFRLRARYNVARKQTSWTPNCWRISCGSTRFPWHTFRRSPTNNCAS